MYDKELQNSKQRLQTDLKLHHMGVISKGKFFKQTLEMNQPELIDGLQEQLLGNSYKKISFCGQNLQNAIIIVSGSDENLSAVFVSFASRLR